MKVFGSGNFHFFWKESRGVYGLVGYSVILKFRQKLFPAFAGEHKKKLFPAFAGEQNISYREENERETAGIDKKGIHSASFFRLNEHKTS